MYSIVLMMAMTSPADDVAFGKRSSGCTGYTTSSYSSCSGNGASCHGDRGGFLGLRNRDRGGSCHGYTSYSSCSGYGASCHGDRGGFLGLRAKFGGRGGCQGAYTGCQGYSNCNACCNTAPACCGSRPVYTCGCLGGTMAAPTTGAAPPVMAEPPAKPLPK